MPTSSINLDFSSPDRQQATGQGARELESAIHTVKTELERQGLSVQENYAERSGTLGPEWLPILTAILSGPAVLVSIRAIRDVLKTYLVHHGSLTVTVKRNGNQIVLDAKNIDSVSESKIAESLGLGK
jgi:hypothetical protein